MEDGLKDAVKLNNNSAPDAPPSNALVIHNKNQSLTIRNADDESQMIGTCGVTTFAGTSGTFVVGQRNKVTSASGAYNMPEMDDGDVLDVIATADAPSITITDGNGRSFYGTEGSDTVITIDETLRNIRIRLEAADTDRIYGGF